VKKLGLDLGNKTLGVAISDPLGFLARPLETFRFEDQDFSKAIQYTLDLINKEKIDTIVLGHPKNMDGTSGEQAQISEFFQKEIEEKSDVTVILWDERLTSKLAQSMMMDQKINRKKRKQNKDTMAAVIILQGYLDSLK
jgi:putative Holliday junction resolvase